MGPADLDSTGKKDLAIVTSVLEEFGLTQNEAKVLSALIQYGSATSGQLAQAAGVVRPNVYRELDALSARSLIEEVPGTRRRWICPGRETVFDRLYEEQDARRRRLRERATEGRQALARMDIAPSVAIPYVRILRPRQVEDVHVSLFSKAQSEVLVCSRAPFGTVVVQPAQTEAIARGLESRALYRKIDWEDPTWREFFLVADAYAEAGVQIRLAADLPLSFVVFDASAALVALEDPINPVPAGPTPLHVTHPGFSVALVDLFESYWLTAEPYRAVGG